MIYRGWRWEVLEKDTTGWMPVLVDGELAGHLYRRGCGVTSWWAQGLSERYPTYHSNRCVAADRLVMMVDTK